MEPRTKTCGPLVLNFDPYPCDRHCRGSARWPKAEARLAAQLCAPSRAKLRTSDQPKFRPTMNHRTLGVQGGRGTLPS